jgi:lipoprotein-anchoring transpeptidase ErfK/SrfK
MMHSYFSRKYYYAPMPHAIFFYHGFAIHGTNDISRLGGPASHGCVRLHPSNAAPLFSLVQHSGPRNTTIEISN